MEIIYEKDFKVLTSVWYTPGYFIMFYMNLIIILEKS